MSEELFKRSFLDIVEEILKTPYEIRKFSEKERDKIISRCFKKNVNFLFEIDEKYISENLINEIINKDIEDFTCIPQNKISFNIAKKVLNFNGYYIKNISENILNQELSDISFKQSHWNFQVIKKQFRSKEMCKKAVEIDPYLARYIPDDTITNSQFKKYLNKLKDVDKDDIFHNRCVFKYFKEYNKNVFTDKNLKTYFEINPKYINELPKDFDILKYSSYIVYNDIDNLKYINDIDNLKVIRLSLKKNILKKKNNNNFINIYNEIKLLKESMIKKDILIKEEIKNKSIQNNIENDFIF